MKIFQSHLVKNGIWGLAANVLQTLFVSLFFVLVARKYSAEDFAHFILATTIYQLVVAFSTMGLGQWFIREFAEQTDKYGFTGKFLKIQVGLGFLFYLIDIGLAIILYTDDQVRWLSFILGANIIFDNLIYVLSRLNIAEFRQKKTAIIMAIDGFLKLITGCLLFVYPFSIIWLAVLVIAVRFVTVNLFMKLGSSHNINFKFFLASKIVVRDIKRVVLQNWRFIVIGSVYIVNWRLANIIISKYLTSQDVANYEISFRVFSMVLLMSAIASTTVYPQFIKLYNGDDKDGIRKLYRTVFVLYTLFAMLSYTFIYSFAGSLIPFAFGSNYGGAIESVKLMFLTILVSATGSLQANLLVAMKLERMDMTFNIIGLVINISGCIIGLYFYKSLSVINYSILGSVIVFHILQDIILVRRKISTAWSVILFYMATAAFVFVYQYGAARFNSYLIFLISSSILALISVSLFYRNKKKYTYSMS